MSTESTTLPEGTIVYQLPTGTSHRARLAGTVVREYPAARPGEDSLVVVDNHQQHRAYLRSELTTGQTAPAAETPVRAADTASTPAGDCEKEDLVARINAEFAQTLAGLDAQLRD